MKKTILFCIISLCFILVPLQSKNDAVLKCGADRVEEYIPLLKGKKIGVVANKASYIYPERVDKSIKRKFKLDKDIHLIDFLVAQKIDVKCVFAPEHGFRGNADAGEKVGSGIDPQTGVMVYSLYDGKSGKPSNEIMKNLDVVIFDLQDVGLRYYTYLTTMVKLMEACAYNNVEFIILDRPNPNGHYVDGPILDMKYRSTVGYLPIPIVHGMTLGELAFMVNGEFWLPDSLLCNLNVIECDNYTHKTMYELPTAPSPNLPNMRSIYLYPSLCYFEATPVSLGRGTDIPFQCYGHPNMLGYQFTFTPRSRFGAKNPPQMNYKCYGVDLSLMPDNEYIFDKGVDLTYLIDAYNNLHLGDHFFRPFFEKLIGVDWVRTMIKQGNTALEIKEKWSKDVEKFKCDRKKYLIYKE